jgi:hypothetical protein
MKRYRVNRKKQGGSLFPAPLAAVLTLTALITLSYLWLCGRCDAISREIQELESRRVELRRRVVAEEYRWAQLNTRSRVQAALERFGMVMESPEERRIVRLVRPVEIDDLEPAPRLVLQPSRAEANFP